jgi:hypothetical protein
MAKPIYGWSSQTKDAFLHPQVGFAIRRIFFGFILVVTKNKQAILPLPKFLVRKSGAHRV